MTDGNDVELEERNDLFLYVEERWPRKRSQESEDEIFSEAWAVNRIEANKDAYLLVPEPFLTLSSP
jgi:hypothetical protein